ncbi:hypothetical protein [Streptomyces sp. NPDC018059]|uniref:hypothetical protein n=1 Tax=Streptomyces sp. NPDC018059 TaxID=3365041 RepID=UPI0037B56028
MTVVTLLAGPVLLFVVPPINAVLWPGSEGARVDLSAENVSLFVYVALLIGVLVTIAIVLFRTASAPWFIARHYYAARRLLPRNLLAFLRDAHENRGVLRQVGAVYQFRHLHLQHQLGAGRRPADRSARPAIPRGGQPSSNGSHYAARS